MIFIWAYHFSEVFQHLPEFNKKDWSWFSKTEIIFPPDLALKQNQTKTLSLQGISALWQEMADYKAVDEFM